MLKFYYISNQSTNEKDVIMKKCLLILLLLNLLSCSSESTSSDNSDNNNAELYFPPTTSNNWDTISPESLNWSTSDIDNLKTFLSDNNTRAFIILQDGKIVLEEYWGQNLTNTSDFNEDSLWYWASAGKTLTAFLTGIAQQENLLNINDKTSDYLDVGWTNTPVEKEALITIKNQLTMTTGLNYEIADIDCTESNCLTYKTNAGSQWFYHNGPYTLIQEVVSNATNKSYNNFTKDVLSNKIGIQNGEWTPVGFNNVFFSTAKDAARFGLLLLNEGVWDNEIILDDKYYFNAMTNSSQELNPAYGYLTWLNGKSSIIYPGASSSINSQLSKNAPDDLYGGFGKNGQFIDVIPSKNMVVIRLGDNSTDQNLVPTTFHDEMWEYINAALP